MSADYEILPFDPHAASPDLWTAFHAYRRAIHQELWPGDDLLSDAEREENMRLVEPFHERVRWVAVACGAVVGSAGAGYRKPGAPNADEHAAHLYADGSVLTQARRQGIGSGFLRELLALMHRLDKTLLTLAAHTEPGHAFLAGAGAVEKHRSVTSRAYFKDVPWETLREWEEAGARAGVTWECHAGTVPRERLISLLPEFTALFADVPMGGLDTAPVRYEIEGYDHWYQLTAQSGGAHHLILALAPDGSVAGMTEALWDARTPRAVDQQLTAVAPGWRGRGLAKALKAAMLRQMRESHPQAEFVRTGNGEENAAMRGINARAGFRPHKQFVEYQVTRDALDAWAARTAGRGRA
jgi:GNAT superfamily N-acetyltransferase